MLLCQRIFLDFSFSLFPRSGVPLGAGGGRGEAPAVCPRQLRASNLPVWTHKIKDPPGVLIKDAKLRD